MSVAERVTVRRVAGAGRGVCVDRLTADERRGRLAGSVESGRTTLWELGVLALLGVALWWVGVNWPFGRSGQGSETAVWTGPTNEVVMWNEHDSEGGAKVTWLEEPTRWPWWATVIVAGLAGAGLFGAGYGWGRWVEAGWWHRKRGEIE